VNKIKNEIEFRGYKDSSKSGLARFDTRLLAFKYSKKEETNEFRKNN